MVCVQQQAQARAKERRRNLAMATCWDGVLSSGLTTTYFLYVKPLRNVSATDEKCMVRDRWLSKDEQCKRTLAPVGMRERHSLGVAATSIASARASYVGFDMFLGQVAAYQANGVRLSVSSRVDKLP